MRSVLALSAVACVGAFTIPTSTSSLVANTRLQSQTSILLAQSNNNDVELVPSLKFMTAEKKNDKPKQFTVRQRIQKVGLKAWERMDTLKAAGLHDETNGLVPMQSGFKTNVGLLVGAFLFKWYRARFITKVCVCMFFLVWDVPYLIGSNNVYFCHKTTKNYSLPHSLHGVEIDSCVGSSASMVSYIAEYPCGQSLAFCEHFLARMACNHCLFSPHFNPGTWW